MGNRLTETTEGGTTTYVYDEANRLATVGGVAYAWSNNGNLLSDGATTYTYDHANRLATAVQGGTNYALSYNGLGDRLRQTVGGTPINYTLDLAGGLTQVLSDGGNAYLYGTTRIGERQPGGWQYHLGDGLGSVRQLVDASVSVTLSRTYEPFGDPMLTAGAGSSTFAFAGEQRDATGLVYLRARYYAPPQGRFLTRDAWEGDPNQPMSYNAWLYVYADPLNTTDPSGMCADDDGDGRCDRSWLYCRHISDPELFEQCACDTPTPQPARLIPSRNCELFVANWEACVLTPYNDGEEPDQGNCTVGIGRLVHPDPCDYRSQERRYRPRITQELAWAMFRSDLWVAASGVRTHVRVPLSQYQFDAMVSFAFNLGIDRFAASPLLETLNKRDYGSIPEALTHYVRSGEDYPPGLARRRSEEADIFTTGMYLPIRLRPVICTLNRWW